VLPTGEQTYNLFKHSIAVGPAAKVFRVWLWHLNELSTGGDFWVHLGARLSDGNGTVSSFVGADGHSTNFFSIGLCLAKIQLYQTFDDPLQSVSLSTSETSVWRHIVNPSNVLGALLQFTVTADTNCTLFLRTLVSSSTSLSGSFDDPLTAVSGAPGEHVRGFWDKSQITLPCGSFDVAPNAQPASRRIGCCEKLGKEETAFPHNHPLATRNAGLFGVNLFYEFTLENSGSQAHPCYVYVECRNTGSAYFGALDVREPTDYEDRGLEHIGGTGNPHFAMLTTPSRYAHAHLRVAQ